MRNFSQLLTPLKYLKIKHTSKIYYDLWIPLLLTIVILTTLFLSIGNIRLTGDNGLLFVVTDLVKVLTGFYIAALAAVATFNKPSMDELISGEPVTLLYKSKSQPSKLTRRRFLCFLFGYLAFLGLFIYFIGAFANLFSTNIPTENNSNLYTTLKWVFSFIYIFIATNLIITTLLGLHFLTDRIHR